jgi:hypothetical protein
MTGVQIFSKPPPSCMMIPLREMRDEPFLGLNRYDRVSVSKREDFKMASSKTVAALYTLSSVALGAWTTPVAAGEMKDTGTVTYQTTQLTHSPLAGGKFLTEVRRTGVVVANNPPHPFHLASQDCLGTEIGDGKGLPEEGHGTCVNVDKDGDVWWFSYSNKGDDRKWSVVSGTGKYVGMTGGGTTKILVATPDGRLTIAFAATLNMK